MNYILFTIFVSLVSGAQEVLLQVDASFDSSKLAGGEVVRSWRMQQPSVLSQETTSVLLRLPDGVLASLRLKKARYEGKLLHWQGTVEGDPLGQASFVQNGARVRGEVAVGGRRFVFTSLRNQLMATEITHSEVEGPYDTLPRPDFSAQTAVTVPSTDNFIDVMVLYTDDVAVNADAEDTLRARVDATNQMLASSCANFRYRLVYIGQVAYAETGAFLTDLTALSNTSDGIMDGIHALRDTYGADLVQLVTDTGDACGLGYLGQEGFFNEDFGFSVSSYWCNARTMAHEWGHNLSISHDRYEEEEALDSQTLMLDGYGYVDMANKYRDVMSYNTQCSDAGVTCTALELFSNAKISNNGIPFGIQGYSDSVSRMNEAFPYVANFRTAIDPYVASLDNNCVSSSDNKDLHCFVASTVYKSYHHQNVKKLRDFRDRWLKGHFVGQSLIKFYYQQSPRWANKLAQYPWALSVIGFLLSVLVFFADSIVYLVFLQGLLLIAVFSYRKKQSMR